MEVLARLEPAARLEDRRQPLARRARIRRRLQHDELALLESRRDVQCGAEDDREVRLALGRERRLERDQDRVCLRQRVVVGRDLDQAGLDEPLQRLGRHVTDVALSALDLRDLLRVRLDEDDPVPGVCEHLGERQADIARADDRDWSLHRGAIVQTPYGRALETYQRFAVGSVLKNVVSRVTTFCTPLFDGCVPSASTSSHVHWSPSLRPASPSVHRYGPQPTHGPLSLPLMRSWITARTAKPPSYAAGSGFQPVIA